MRQFPRVTSLLLVLVLVVGSAAESVKSLYKKGQDAEARQDYMAAYEAYNQAYQQRPTDLKYRVAYQRTRFLAAAAHVNKGQVMRESGDLAGALAEFEYANKIDPSSFIAIQEMRRTKAAMDAAAGTPAGTPPPAPPVSPITKRLNEAAGPIELAPLSDQPLTLEMSDDSKKVYETIGKLAGINVLFDSEYTPKRVTLKLNGVSLQEAFDILAFHSGTFWRPVTPNTIYVAANTPAKRKELEQNVLKTFYLSNISAATDMQDITTALRTVLEFSKMSQVNSQNAIIIRDTPDKIAMAEKLINDLDKGKPEVVVDIAIMQVRRDKLRNLGVTPPSSASVQLTGPTSSTTTTGTTGTTTTPTTTNNNNLTLNTFQALKATDFAVSIPSATANFLYTDNNSKLLQNPQIRSSDGVKASLKIGDRVPIATGSIGNPLGGIGNLGSSGLVNTQFQYLDVGVNIDITPRVYPGREVGLKLVLDVSSVTGTSNIGGISQPIISQRKIEHDIRLKEGEVNVVGGIFEQTDSNSVAGLPWLAQLPFFKYFFSSENKEKIDNEIVFILIPHIIRGQELTDMNTRAIDIGTANYLDLRRVTKPAANTPATAAPQTAVPQPPPAQTPATQPQTNQPASPSGGAASLRFNPAAPTPAAGSNFTVEVMVNGAADLFSAPIQIGYDPSLLQFVSITNGDMLTKDGQAVALVHREDAGSVQASATRPPGSGGVTGEGTLYALTFQAKKAGQGLITLRPMFRSGTMQVIPVPSAALNVTVH